MFNLKVRMWSALFGIILFSLQVSAVAAQDTVPVPITAETASQLTRQAVIGSARIRSGAWSANGAYMAVAKGNQIYLYDGDGNLIRVITNTVDYISVALSPDGRWLVMSDTDGGVEMRETATDDVRFHNFWSAIEPPRSLTFSPDGRELAIANGRTVNIWAVTPDGFYTSLYHGATVNEAVFIPNAPDGTYWLMTAADDGGLRIWDVERRRAISAAFLPVPATRVAVSPDGEWIASASDDSDLFIQSQHAGIFRSDRRQLLGSDSPRSPSSHRRSPGLAFSSDGQRLYYFNMTSYWQHSFVDGHNRWQLFQLPVEDTAGANSLTGNYSSVIDFALSRDGATLFALTTQQAVLLEADSLQPIKALFEDPTLLAGFVFTADGDAMYTLHYTGGGLGGVRHDLRQIDPDQIVGVPNCQGNPYQSCLSLLPNAVRPTQVDCIRQVSVVSADGNYEATCIHADSTEGFRVTDPDDDATILDVPLSHIDSIGFSPDSRYVAARSSGCSRWLAVWEISSGQQMMAVDDVIAMGGFSHDGSVLAVATGTYTQPDTYTVTLYNVPTGEIVNVLRGFETYIVQIGFSPDGSLLAIRADGDRDITLWGYDADAPPYQLGDADRPQRQGYTGSC